MKTNRRSFLAAAGLSLGAASLTRPSALAAESSKPPNFLLKTPRMRLGTVTYNLAKDWDVPTIIRHCEEAKFQGVELRTTHAHGVEVQLTQVQRADVKKRFADSTVEL